jgi:hypothetical protein
VGVDDNCLYPASQPITAESRSFGAICRGDNMVVSRYAVVFRASYHGQSTAVLMTGVDGIGVSGNGGDLSNCEGRGLSRYIRFSGVSIERRRLERRPWFGILINILVGSDDQSGHIFILTHASLFLWWEILPAFSNSTFSSTPAAKVTPTNAFWKLIVKINLGILALWWFSLLNTSIYFHTVLEKISGLIAGLIGWYIVEVVVRGLFDSVGV